MSVKVLNHANALYSCHMLDRSRAETGKKIQIDKKRELRHAKHDIIYA